MAKDIELGARVSWNTPEGRAEGVVVRKAVYPLSIGETEIKASADDPRYVVKDDANGELAAYKPRALRVIETAPGGSAH